jgi:spermidine synthase
MRRTLFAVRLLFLASGASALMFETLWFHQARLVLGSSVWASSLVPAAFMAGLAVGSGLAGRHGDSLARPLRAYALLELAVAASGLLLVHFLPVLEGGLAPLFRPFLDDTATLAALRLGIAFVLLLLPSTAMGLTLPLLTRALTDASVPFGRALGQLYGWNTLGAVVGAVGAEAGLIAHLGIHGTSVVAASLNGVAAAGALLVARNAGRPPAAVVPVRVASWAREEARWLVVAALSGAALLALEVVWFRVLSIYAITSSFAFALMLAVVLGGIALGGLVGAVWLARDPSAYRFTGAVLFAAGASMVGSYASSHAVVEAASLYVVRRPLPLLELGVPLMLPTALLSGVVFTLTGSALRASVGRDAAAAGHLTLFNTAGAALGSLAAGFVLLPSLGMERSLFVVALVYGIVACVAAVGSLRRATLALGLVFAAGVLLFPFGSMRRDHFVHPIERWSQDRGADVQVREGLTETSLYVEKRFAGHTRSHRLVTNSITMASTDVRNRRYMKLFVYLPVAVHPGPRSALLVSFGVGATAKALTDTRELERIDVVDVSRDILEMSRVVFPDPADNPIHDPRVHVHVEDGRFFLQATDRRFDVITAEPPPPALAGVVDLYSEEYFRLVHDRLSEGGIASYWLPTHSLAEDNALAVLRAFCDVFDDCSLWNGFGTDLVLLGTRGARGPVSEARFEAQWSDPRVLAELRALGLEAPVRLATLFIAGREDLDSLTAAALPVVDDFPARVVPPPAYPGYDERSPGLYGAWVNADRARERFVASPLVKRLLPDAVRAEALPAFEAQGIVNGIAYALPPDFTGRMQRVHALLTRTTLEAPIAWILGSDSDVQRVLGQLSPAELLRPEPQFHVAVQRLSRRDLEATLEPLQLAEADPALNEPALLLRLYVLLSLGRTTDADRLVTEISASLKGHASLAPFLAWLRETFPPANGRASSARPW